MAQRTVIELLDDLDGESEAVETVAFGLDGRDYEIDLSEENAARLREALREWTPHARKTGRAGSRASGSSVPRARRSAEGDTTAIREWAKGAGYEVSTRGRIAAKIREAYRAAMG